MQIKNYSHYWIGLIALLILLFFNKALANESVIIKKYGFGFERRSSDGNPVIYPNNYPVTDEDIGRNYSSGDVDVRLVVKQSIDSVLAVITFSNNSSQSYFLPKIYYPMRFDKDNGQVSDALCGKKISIITGDINLDYLNGSCPFDFDVDISRWTEIKPEENISLQIKLNDMYAFLPGERDYYVKTLKYKLVKSKWFVLKSINKSFFSILMKRNSCDNYNSEAIFDSGVTCDDPEFDENISFFVKNFWDKDDSDNSIYANSNEVFVKINGSKIRYPY
ncbi:hypothetical protein JZC40_003991 [Salmonella enterica subsp. enterica serovar Moero]|nr:hypothetical protein [Salmonella enterica subsp. enterica serovar Moero]